MAVLTLSGVSFTYPGASKPAVENLSATVESGRWVALLGANGSGKSTLARLMAGLLSPTEGSVTLDGQSLRPEWNGIGIIFQNPDEGLFNPTVEREIAWGLENIATPPAEMEVRVSGVLERFGLQILANREPFTLSDGQKQLTALASILVMNPPLLIFDEPTAYLDPWWKRRLLVTVRESCGERGVVWFSTRAAEAVEADEVWLLHEGRLAERGAPEVMLRNERLERLGIVPQDWR